MEKDKTGQGKQNALVEVTMFKMMAWKNLFENGTFADKYLGEVHFKQREKTVLRPWGRPHVNPCLMWKTARILVCLGKGEWKKNRRKWNERGSRFMLSYVSNLKTLSFNFHNMNRYLLEDFREVVWYVTFLKDHFCFYVENHFEEGKGESRETWWEVNAII